MTLSVRNLAVSCCIGYSMTWTLFIVIFNTSLSETRFPDSIPETELPRLYIYITDGAVAKLQKKRRIAFSEGTNGHPILLSSEDDWVNGTIVANDGINTKMVNVRLRLKGDGPDHWKNRNKLSFRIKVTNSQLVWGMSKFSVQQPSTRNYQNEALVMGMMRSMGVLAPRYFFVDVRLNNQNVGIMALEEHFTTELVKSQNRREGPIVMIDEDWVWQQRFLNLNRMSREYWKSVVEKVKWRGGILWQNTDLRLIPPLALRDYPVQIFQRGNFTPGTIRSQNMIRGASLLRDMVDGKIPGSLVFDYDLMSRWWILAHIWGGQHNVHFTNERFYFNPITGLLEPIAYDVEGTTRATMSLASQSDFWEVGSMHCDRFFCPIDIGRLVISTGAPQEHRRNLANSELPRIS